MVWDKSSGMSNPMTATGDLIVGGSGGTPARLATGTSAQVLYGGSTPSYQAAPSGGGLESTTVTANTNIEDGKSYLSNSASQLEFTLPATMAVGFKFAIYAIGTGGFTIKSNASATSNNIVAYRDFSSASSTSTLVLAETETQYGYIELECIVANTTLLILNREGTSPALYKTNNEIICQNNNNFYIKGGYKFSNGSLLADTVGSNTLTNSSSAVTNNSSGKDGYCAAFNGTNQQLKISGNVPDYDFLGEDFTISAWVYHANNTSAQGIISLNDTSDPNSRPLCLYTYNTKVVLSCKTSAGAEVVEMISSNVIAATTWTNIIINRIDSDFTIYLNGVKDSTASSSSPLAPNPGFSIGAFYFDDESTQLMNGRIDEVVIYKGVGLSPTEVEELADSAYLQE